MDLTEAKDIKTKWQEYTEELYKKDLHDTDNHDGMTTHLEPDILECGVSWALGSITMNKASGGDGIPVEVFQILKYDDVKVLHSICQQIWKTQQWPQDWKRSVFISIPKKGNAKESSNYHTVALISHVGSSKKQESSRKTSSSALLTMPKPLIVWITTNWKILQEMRIPCHLTRLLGNLYSGQEATVRTGHGTTDCFQIGKGVHQGYILSPCLFNLYAEYIM